MSCLTALESMLLTFAAGLHQQRLRLAEQGQLHQKFPQKEVHEVARIQFEHMTT